MGARGDAQLHTYSLMYVRTTSRGKKSDSREKRGFEETMRRKGERNNEHYMIRRSVVILTPSLPFPSTGREVNWMFCNLQVCQGGVCR